MFHCHILTIPPTNTWPSSEMFIVPALANIRISLPCPEQQRSSACASDSDALIGKPHDPHTALQSAHTVKHEANQRTGTHRS